VRREPPRSTANRILKALSEQDRAQVRAAGSLKRLAVKQRIYDDDQPITTVVFIESGIVSLVNYLENGRIVETATVGREGFVGLPVVWQVASTPGEAFVQVEGSGLAIPARRLPTLLRDIPALHSLLHRYAQVLFTQIAQASACNRGHDVAARCARWVLMTHDRVDNDTFLLTQEFLAQMLGVRRAGVSAAAGVLRREGYIGYSRGRMTVLDRAGLESAACSCYRIIRREIDRVLPS
jgi:CRP-like cAMP-binding protein